MTVDDFVDGRGENTRAIKRVKFKLRNKRAALVDLGRHLGMFQDSNHGNAPAFQINIHLGDDPERQKRWDEQVRRRAAAAIPVVGDDDDARANRARRAGD